MGKCFMQAKIINVFIIFDASLHSYSPFCDFYFYTLQVPAITWMVVSACLPTVLSFSPSLSLPHPSVWERLRESVCVRHSLKSGVIGNGTESDPFNFIPSRLHLQQPGLTAKSDLQALKFDDSNTADTNSSRKKNIWFWITLKQNHPKSKSLFLD